MFKIVLFFIFTNLVQIKEKTNTPVTVFLIMFLMKTYICIGFRNGMFSWYTVFMADTKIKEHISLSLEKKNFCLCNFEESLLRYAYMPACTSAIMRVSLTSLHLKARFNKSIIVFIMGAIIH